MEVFRCKLSAAHEVLPLKSECSLAGLQCLLSTVLVCSCIAASEVLATAHPAATNAFSSSLPVIGSKGLTVSSVLPHSAAASAKASAFWLTRGISPANKQVTFTLPTATRSLSDSELHHHLTDVPSARSNSPSKASSSPTSLGSVGSSSATSCPICFIVGLLLSVAGTLISAVGDICIRYSFIRPKEADCVSAAASALADAGLAGAQNSLPVSGSRETSELSESDSGVHCYNHIFSEASTPAVAVGPRDCLRPGNTSNTSVPCKQYCSPEQMEIVSQQIECSIIHEPQQRIYGLSLSALANPSFPTSSWPRHSVTPHVPSQTEHLQGCGACTICTGMAETGAITRALSSTHSPVRMASSVKPSASANIPLRSKTASKCCWEPVVTLAHEPCREHGCMMVLDNALTPENGSQATGLFQMPCGSIGVAPPAQNQKPEPIATNVAADGVQASAPMSRTAAVAAKLDKESRERRRDRSWIVGIFCTCIISPVLSIISLSLLPANVTGFAALQILFVLLLARYVLGEVVGRVNLGGGVFVVVGLISLTWSSKSVSALPDRATLCRQLLSPPAIVFEICCGCIILSGLLLLVFTSESYHEKDQGANIAVERLAELAVPKDTLTETLLFTEAERTYIGLSPQREQQERRHQNVQAGALPLQGRCFAMGNLHACAPDFQPGLLSLQRGAAPVQQSTPASSTISTKYAPYRHLENPKECEVDNGPERTTLSSAAASDKARTAKNNAKHPLQTNTACVTSLGVADSAEDTGNRSGPRVRPRLQCTNWYPKVLSHSRCILLPMAAGVSGAVASICLKLVQAFVVSLSAACHDIYNRRSLHASPAAVTMLSSHRTFVSLSVSEVFFPPVLTPFTASFLARGLSDDVQLPVPLHATSSTGTPSPPAAPPISAAAAAPEAQSVAPDATVEETENLSHLLICLLNPSFLAAHLQLPLLLVAAAAAAVAELVFLSHTLKNQPASEGVPLMNAALTLSMGLGGLTLLGAAPDSPAGWGLGLGLLVVGVGILGFGGKTWLAVRKYLLHVVGVAETESKPLHILTECNASVDYLAIVGDSVSDPDVRVDDCSVGINSNDMTIVCEHNIRKIATTSVETGTTGFALLEEAQVVSRPSRTQSRLATAGSPAEETQLLSVRTATAARLLKATGVTNSCIGETGGTAVAGAPQPENSVHHSTEREVSPYPLKHFYVFAGNVEQLLHRGGTAGTS